MKRKTQLRRDKETLSIVELMDKYPRGKKRGGFPNWNNIAEKTFEFFFAMLVIVFIGFLACDVTKNAII